MQKPSFVALNRVLLIDLSFPLFFFHFLMDKLKEDPSTSLERSPLS